MEVFSPVFFKDFRCLGSQCKDNCCRMGWDIEIDPDTYNYYKSLDNGICSHITSQGGEYYIKQENGQCPFLNREGLCSVLLEYGQEHISEICAQHPRFYQWFGEYKEAGTGLCCEESARLWLEHAGHIEFCAYQTCEQEDDLEFDSQSLDAVLKARKVLIDLMQQQGLSLSRKLKALLIFGLNAQQADDGEIADCFNELAQAFSDKQYLSRLVSQLGADGSEADRLKACAEVMGCFEELEYMKDLLPGVIDRIRLRLEDILSAADAFDRAHPEAERQLCAVAVYNIYRYVIQCARGADCMAILAGCILNVWFVRMWDILLWLEGKFDFDGQIPAVKEYSKEVEYSDNTDRLWEGVYTDSRLSAENIKLISEV
ncbi:flagellin lysine-N-methylase [Ruminococcus sp. FC2018]|uniref:flagellin lysine-N-methylase n=1 Tax=Ruminococcus sp. FC2018 TaxID=1410617 RepID=UPI00048FE3AD|nr:flagellin lysine-N-methylase [Ruminococcus sp. FC2018]